MQVRLRAAARVAAAGSRLPTATGSPGPTPIDPACRCASSTYFPPPGSKIRWLPTALAPPESGTLRQEVRQPRERGASGDKVGLTVVNGDNPTVRWRQDRPPESDEAVHRLDRQQGPPVSLRSGPRALIDRHEVDRVGLSAEVRAMAGTRRADVLTLSQHPVKGSLNTTGDRVGSGRYSAAARSACLSLDTSAGRRSRTHP